MLQLEVTKEIKESNYGKMPYRKVKPGYIFRWRSPEVGDRYFLKISSTSEINNCVPLYNVPFNNFNTCYFGGDFEVEVIKAKLLVEE